MADTDARPYARALRFGDPAPHADAGAARPGAGGASARQMAARARIEKLAWLLDSAVRVPGTNIRVGLDGILGIAPGIGDAAGSALALYLVYEANKLGVPRHVIARMLANVGIDFAVGAVPLLGDVFDVFFKASTRNMRLLRKHLDGPTIEGRYERR